MLFLKFCVVNRCVQIHLKINILVEIIRIFSYNTIRVFKGGFFMINYTGSICPICKKDFTEDDDIVVCPECGTPYHKNCYSSIGHCMFQDKHGQYEYQIKNNENTASDDKVNETLICPYCSSKNPISSKICSKCGSPLSQNKNVKSSYQNINTPFSSFNKINKDENFNGVTAQNLSDYVGPNSFYYIPEFKNIKDFGSSRFNFSAFLFSGIWFLYRKQYKIGTIITILMFILIISSTCIEILHNAPIIISLLKNAGIDLNSSYTLNSQNMQNLMLQIAPLPIFDKIMLILPSIISFVKIIIMIICGVNANKFYFKHCVKSIKQIKNSNNLNVTITNLIISKGGTNKAIAISMLFTYFIIVYFLKFALL